MNRQASVTIPTQGSANDFGPLGALLRERDALHEEVRQLRAAVQIYTEVLRRLRMDARRDNEAVLTKGSAESVRAMC